MLSVSRNILKTSEFLCPQVFRSVTFGRFEASAVFCEQFSFPSSLTTFTTHSSGRLVRNDGLDFVCQNLFLRCGQENLVLCILLRSSMILMVHLPRFLCICNYFCFAGTVVETNCTPPTVEDMFVFLLYECAHPVHILCVLFVLLPSSFCNRVMISCSIHGVADLYSCEESLRNSSFLVE